MDNVEKFKHIKEFISTKATGLDYSNYKLIDNYTGFEWEAHKSKVQNLGEVKNYKSNLVFTTGDSPGKYVNSEQVGQFIATPKTVGEGRLGFTRTVKAITGVDLEVSK